ncbi:MAG TPA: site-specific integrase [Candidatus Bathyarchaeota archaeon]|nr:site-specific integrase [Candidatus Bathyarchaeota archaeon]
MVAGSGGSSELEKVLSRLPRELREELEEFFIDRYDRMRSVSSRLAYAYVALSLVRHAGIRSLRELDKQAYVAWKRALVRSGASDFTIRSYITRVKALVRWAREGDLPAWLRGEKGTIWDLYSSGEHLRDKILRPEELRALMEACEHPRDRAIIAVLAETGLRIGELLSLRMRDVEELEDGAYRLRVRGKTGLRTVVAIRSAPFLSEWLEVHPLKGEADAPLWTTIRGKPRPLRPKAFREHLRDLARRAGLKRNVHPHMLRHTRFTQLARVLTEQELKVVAGWSKASRMAGVYVHLSGRDAEAALRKASSVEGPFSGLPSPGGGSGGEGEGKDEDGS